MTARHTWDAPTLQRILDGLPDSITIAADVPPTPLELLEESVRRAGAWASELARSGDDVETIALLRSLRFYISDLLVRQADTLRELARSTN